MVPQWSPRHGFTHVSAPMGRVGPPMGTHGIPDYHTTTNHV